ncbi:MAG: MFS transporter [Thermoguttaceae bacterium]|jgi:fucose permease
MRYKTLPIFLAFFVMGVADAMGPMSEAVKSDYQVSTVVSRLLSFFVFIAFAVFSVPGGLLAARIGKKKLLLLGLGLNAVAVLVPTLLSPGFPLLLGCIFLLGIGTAFLQVAGNPIMRDVSAPGSYSRNLSFAQGIKGLGSTASTYLTTYLVTAIASIALFQGMGWRSSFPLFFGCMAVAFLAVAVLKVEETKSDEPPSIASSLGLLKEPVFFLAVLGIFLYVGAESCMGNFLLPAMKGIGVDEKTAAMWFGPATFLLLLAIGRLLGGAVLTVMSPRAFFRLSALLGLLGAAAIMLASKPLAIAGVFAAGLGFANIWPMLFSITVEEKPQRASELSGLMCMAISGGAIVPLVMAKLIDLHVSEAQAFIVPTLCFAYLLVLSLRGGRTVPSPLAGED